MDARDPHDAPTTTWAGSAYEKAAQEFAAGAHPVTKELVMRRDDGRRILVLAVDPLRQPRLLQLFGSVDPTRRGLEGTTSWRVLHGPGDLGPTAIRLDLVFRRPVRCRVHLVFSPRNELIVHSGVDCDDVCLITDVAFAQLEDSGYCREPALVLPAPPAGDLTSALGR